MRIGVLENGWWGQACAALSHDAVELPTAHHASGNPYAAELQSRIEMGSTATEFLGSNPLDLLVDNGGSGLGFVPGRNGPSDLALAHEVAGIPLCSHFIDPIVTAFQGLDWSIVWQCLKSGSWIKAVWDRAQVAELQQFGVSNVMHLPMAAQDREYDTRPVDPRKCTSVVSFVGGQNTSFFHPTATVPANSLFAGTLAQAVRGQLRNLTFYDIYHDLYHLGEPVRPDDPHDVRVKKTLAYFQAKLFHNASLCIRNRDRFVIFLKRKLGDTFRLIGSGWDAAYGLRQEPRIETAEGYFGHIRDTAININLVNGNAETGLNMRHFEITAAGGFMLCYEQPEIEEHFEIGRECVVFRDEADLLEKIDYYLSHPDERCAIALAGQKRTLSQHLYSHRLKTLLPALGLRPPPVEFSTGQRWDEITSLLPEPAVVLDCGANTGQTATCFRNLYPNAEIYSFEPVEALFEQLRRTCDRLNVTAVKKAVADRDGHARINLTASPEANSLLAFQEGNPCAQWTHVTGEELVEVCTLDRWCEEAGIDRERVDLLKLDVQGAELQALYGARKLLQTTKLVYVEVSFVEIYKDLPLFEDIDRFLKECGYRRHAIYPSDQPHNWGDALYVKDRQPQVLRTSSCGACAGT